MRGLNRWDIIADDVILGVYPKCSDVEHLYSLGVRTVINTCEEKSGPTSSYKKFGIEEFRIPIVDFTSPTLSDIKRSIEQINQHRGTKGAVYIHCKSGRGRSPTIVLCWLIQFYKLSPIEAQQRLQDRRQQVLTNLYKRKVVREYWLDFQKSLPPEHA